MPPDRESPAPASDAGLRLDGVSYAYGRFTPKAVFDELSLQVRPGRRTLLLGPNGAGKSTLLKLMASVLRPQHGSVSFNGDSGRHVLQENVAWMPQRIDPIRGLTVRQQVEYAAWLGGMSRSASSQRAEEAIRAVHLEEQQAQKSTQLSGGQLRRLGLAQTLVRESSVLLLDEPTAGLDPAQASRFAEILDSLQPSSGLVISTHQVADVAAHVDWIVAIDKGQVRFDGTVDEFRGLAASVDASSDSIAAVFAAMMAGGLH